MKSQLLLALLVLPFFGCKKEAKITAPESAETKYYQQLGLKFIHSVHSESAEIIPCFIGKIPNQDAFKIIYQEKVGTKESGHAYILDKGQIRDWNYPYFDATSFALDKKGNLKSGSTTYTIMETSEGDFTKLTNLSYNVFSFNNTLYATSFDYYNAEISNYPGKQFKNMNLMSYYAPSSIFGTFKSFSNKMWEYCIKEYEDNRVLFVYTKDNSVYVSLLNNKFEQTIVASKTSAVTFDRGGCDNSYSVGKIINIINNGNNPFITLEDTRKGNNYYTIFQWDNYTLNELCSFNKPAILFAYNDKIYNGVDNKLQLLEWNSFKDIEIKGVTLLGIYGSEQGIFLAVRNKDNVNTNYIDFVQYLP